jgi:hypothetical protein
VLSRRFAMRLAQAMLVLVLGLSVHTAQGRACFDCGACPGGSCGSRLCEQCPAEWWGSCFAGTEGCAYYLCSEVAQCCITGLSICGSFCDCPPCN